MEQVQDGSYTYYSFTPTNSGTYYFYSNNTSCDTYGVLEDVSGSRLTSDDDEGEGSNFCFSYSCTAGTTYYVGIRNYDDWGSTTVTLNVSTTDPRDLDEQ